MCVCRGCERHLSLPHALSLPFPGASSPLLPSLWSQTFTSSWYPPCCVRSTQQCKECGLSLQEATCLREGWRCPSASGGTSTPLPLSQGPGLSDRQSVLGVPISAWHACWFALAMDQHFWGFLSGLMLPCRVAWPPGAVLASVVVDCTECSAELGSVLSLRHWQG